MKKVLIIGAGTVGKNALDFFGADFKEQLSSLKVEKYYYFKEALYFLTVYESGMKE